MAVFKRDLVDINLETGNIHRSFLQHSIGFKDQQADHFGVRVFRDGEPVNLTGVSVQGVFMPPQGSPIAITSGNIVSGNEAEVVLPQACYNYDGQFTLAIKLVDSSNSVTGTVRIVDGMVDNTNASGTVAPTSAVPTYQEVLSTYEQAIAAINKTVRFDATQSLTDTQKATARSNISAPSVAEMNTAVGNEATARQNADALKVNISDIENDLTGTTAGKVLDARQGKVLDEKVSDVKSATKLYDAVEIAPFTDSGSYSIGAVGSVVGDPSLSVSSTMLCYKFSCSPGDVFEFDIYGSGTSAGGARGYGWLNANNEVISRANQSVKVEGIQYAPENAAYLVVNTLKTYGGYVVKGNNISRNFQLDRNDATDLSTSLSNKGNVIGDYINYGYLEKEELAEISYAAYQGQKIGVKQVLTEVTLNASSAPTSAVRIKLSDGEIRRSSTQSDVQSWTGGVSLEQGHYYKAEARYISGTINAPEGVEYPSISVYKTGESQKVADKVFHGFDSEMTFVADEDKVNILLYVPATVSLSNVVYQVLLQDVTEEYEANTENIFDGKTVSGYNGKTHILSGTANQLYHITLLEIENEEPCAYNFEWDYSNTVYEDGTDGPTIAALDANGENVDVTSVSTGQTATSIKLRNYSSFIHRSIAVIFPATARKIIFGKTGSPDTDAVYSFREIKIIKLPCATVRKYPNYYPFKTHVDYVARDEAKNYGFIHDGTILRMGSTPAAIPVNENHLGYNEFIAQTWDTLLPDNYVEGDPYNANTTKILNVFVERESRWTSTPFRTNTDTYTIYRYTFTPQNGYDRTVFLTSGCHGNEAEGYWGLFRLIKMIYFEGYKYPTLRNLRNVRFIIVPSWNPWGMQHYRRYNAFSALNTPTYDGGKTHQAWNWLFKPSHSITVDGTVYDIEDVGEANVIWETLNEYKGILNLWIDFHTDPYAGRDTTDVDIDDPRPYTNPYGCYGYSAVGSKTFYRMSNVIEDFYNIFVNELNFTPTYHAKESAPGTGMTSWQATLGFPCALVEISTFMNDFPYASGSAEIMKIAQEYYGNCLAELLRS